MEKSDNKIYTIIAGVNGAGKSTMYETLRHEIKGVRINSDEILVLNGGDWKNEKDQIKAGMEAVKRIKHCINEGASFNQETTLAGRSILGTVKKAKEQGYTIKIYYVGLKNADLAIERVNKRVSKGGHGIDEDVIKKRYTVSLVMLKQVLPLCDFAVIYDNSTDFDKIATYKDNKWKVFDHNFKWFKEVLPETVKEINAIKIEKEAVKQKRVQLDNKQNSMDSYIAEIAKARAAKSKNMSESIQYNRRNSEKHDR